MADLEKGECKNFISDIMGDRFPNKEPQEVMCTNGYLESQLTNKAYPTEMKRALFRKQKFTVDDTHWQPSGYKVAGVR